MGVGGLRSLVFGCGYRDSLGFGDWDSRFEVGGLGSRSSAR